MKKLKDRVIHLEQELQDTQIKTGLPISLPYDSTSLKVFIYLYKIYLDNDKIY